MSSRSQSPTSTQRLRRRSLATLGCVTVVAAAAGCATSPSSPGGEAKPSTITLATGFAVSDLDPGKNGYWGNEFGWSELLLRPVHGKAPEPWLLEKLQSTGEKTWVLTLKPGVRFQNGTALDGAKLAALMTYQLANTASLKVLAGTTAKATGAREVTLTTSKPVPNMDYLLADESKFIIFDLDAYLAAKPDSAKLTAAKMYTGPYVVDSIDNQGISMTADKNYWGGPLPLTAVRVKFIADAQARLLAVQNGEADLALYPPTNDAKNIAGRSDAFWLKGPAKGPTFQLQMNMKTGPLADVNVRKALVSGIDYKEIADDVMGGLYQVTNGMYAPNAPYYQPMFATDQAKAKSLLEKSGYTLDGQGKYSKGGVPVTVTILTYPQQPDSGTLGVAVQSQLAKIGMTVKLQQVPDSSAAMQDPKVTWDGAIIGNGTTSFSGDPISPLQTYFVSTGPRNFFGLKDAALDTTIGQLATTMDAGQREALLHRVQDIVGENAYMGFLTMRLPGVVAGPKWKNYAIPPANLWVGFDTKP